MYQKTFRCNHTTNFAVLMAFQIKYKYEKLLDCISYIGVGLSMAGLVIIILFQILTRKTQNLSVKWMLVSLCFSILIFNIISGIENQTFRKCSNDTTRCYQQYLPYDATSNLTSDRMETPTDSWCRVVAVLLHCFLLTAFLWSALSSALLYLLLLRATKPLPGCFLVTMSLIKWGTPDLHSVHFQNIILQDKVFKVFPFSRAGPIAASWLIASIDRIPGSRVFACIFLVTSATLINAINRAIALRRFPMTRDTGDHCFGCVYSWGKCRSLSGQLQEFISEFE
ncbi:LOW QUALITY PROTEIN: adhesion G-protein coupled receptor G7 [Ammospiza maritima maritima]